MKNGVAVRAGSFEHRSLHPIPSRDPWATHSQVPVMPCMNMNPPEP